MVTARLHGRAIVCPGQCGPCWARQIRKWSKPVELPASRLTALYRNRFSSESEQRQQLWQVLCGSFFQRWVPEDAVVLDLAAGQCEFINNIRAGRRIAVDLNPDVAVHA